MIGDDEAQRREERTVLPAPRPSQGRARAAQADVAQRLAVLEDAEYEADRHSLDSGVDLTGDGIVAITARPGRESIPTCYPEDRIVASSGLRLLLAKLAGHFEDITTPSKVKKRKEALAWVLEDVAPGSPGFVASFAGICEAVNLGLGWARRNAIRQAVAAELLRRQRLLLKRGSITKSLEPAKVEGELIEGARRILAKGRQTGSIVQLTQRGVGRGGEVTVPVEPWEDAWEEWDDCEEGPFAGPLLDDVA